MIQSSERLSKHAIQVFVDLISSNTKLVDPPILSDSIETNCQSLVIGDAEGTRRQPQIAQDTFCNNLQKPKTI
jgi:hypothetical protein